MIGNQTKSKRTIQNVLFWNIKGFREIIDLVKINKLKNQQIIHKLVEYDLVFLQETHLDKDAIGKISLPGVAPSIHFLWEKNAERPKRPQGVSLCSSTHHYDPR